MHTLLGLVLAAAAAPVFASSGTPSFPGEAPLDLEEAEVTPRAASTAFLMGFFPGMVVHGAGHFYAKDPEMGATLLGIEGLGLIGFGIGWANWRYGAKYAPYMASDVKAKKGGQNAMLIGGAVFFMSWVADFAHAPISAYNYNKRHKLPLTAMLVPIEGTPSLLLSARF